MAAVQTSNSPFDAPKLKVISWRAVAIGLGGIVVGTIVMAVWLLHVAGSDPGRRLEAIKTAFTIGLASGGTLAVILAARRQWLQERTQVHAEHVAADAAERAERVAASTMHDAAERRATELYVKAADQLGSPKAPVRLAGLYALERLGQEDPKQRQTIVKVICSYLRMPFSAAATGTGEDTSEHEVRRTAQQILGDHLQPRRSDLHWSEIRSVDLSGAHLDAFSMQDCALDSINLNEATLTGESLFRAFECNRAFIQGTIFAGFVDFRGAVVRSEAFFGGSRFDGDAWFHSDDFFEGAHFGGFASFRGCRFAGAVRFARVRFSAAVDFAAAEFVVAPVGLDEVIDQPDARSPEVGHSRSNWPDGWSVTVGADGTGRLRRRRRTAKRAN